MEYDSKTRHSVILHSTLSYTRGVNNNVHTKSEYQVRAHMPIYQRPLSPYRRVPGVPGIPCVASAHGPAGPCLPQAAPGTYGAPCTAAHPGPRDGPASGARVTIAWPPCAVQAVAGASRARPPSYLKRPHRLRWPALANSDLHPPQLPYRPRPRPPWQRLAADSRRTSGGLDACGAQEARLCELAEVRLRGWCNVRPVMLMIVRVSRWLDAYTCVCILGSRGQSAPRSDSQSGGGRGRRRSQRVN